MEAADVDYAVERVVGRGNGRFHINGFFIIGLPSLLLLATQGINIVFMGKLFSLRSAYWLLNSMAILQHVIKSFCNAVNFIQNVHNRQPIFSMVCCAKYLLVLLWLVISFHVWSFLFHILLEDIYLFEYFIINLNIIIFCIYNNVDTD